MVRLPLETPLRAMRELARLSQSEVARRRLVSNTAVIKGEWTGGRMQLTTLAEYAKAMRFRLVIGVEPIEKKDDHE